MYDYEKNSEGKRPQRKDSQQSPYDKILKEHLGKLLPLLLGAVIGLKNYRLENLPQTRLQVTSEREPDFVRLI